jgi:hypothetical protein
MVAFRIHEVVMVSMCPQCPIRDLESRPTPTPRNSGVEDLDPLSFV